MSYASFLPLLKKAGSILTPEKFHERINIVFHDFEADYYDEAKIVLAEANMNKPLF